MRTHLISQVVLKRFTNDEGLVAQHEKKTGKVTLLPPTDIAFTDIDVKIIEQSERRWGADIENHAEKALNTLVNANVLLVPKHANTIKRLMALHYVRSFALLDLMAEAKQKYARQIIENVSSAYPSYRDLVKQKVAEDWPRTVVGSLPKIIGDNVAKVDKFMERHGLEIAHTPQSIKFVIGDIPAITITNKGKMGVPITEADSFAMPLTPTHIVALKTDPESKEYFELTAEQVRAANSKQIQRALEIYYSATKDTKDS